MEKPKVKNVIKNGQTCGWSGLEFPCAVWLHFAGQKHSTAEQDLTGQDSSSNISMATQTEPIDSGGLGWLLGMYC